MGHREVDLSLVQNGTLRVVVYHAVKAIKYAPDVDNPLQTIQKGVMH